MIIWGFGRRTKKVIAKMMSRTCNYCNTTLEWELCVIRTWFTLFFIPIIPYRTEYCIACPKCGSFAEITKEEFEELKEQVLEKEFEKKFEQEEVPDYIKYQGKTETQIKFLKEREELKKAGKL